MNNPKMCWVCGSEITEPIIEKLGTPIESLNLSSRARNCLQRASIESVEQLIQLNRKDFLRVRNLGERTASEIIERVKKFGFDWDI